MATGSESERDRDKRHYQRTLFDGIAERYEASRPGYPGHVVEFVTRTAGLGPGAAVLEVGCGTGQLTEQLARSGFRMTAIDIGPSMIAAARRRVAGADVSFAAMSFEDLDAADASFDLVISSAAFHWIDPEVAFSKSARLLRPGGWLSLLGTEEQYDDPIGTAMDVLWITHGDTGGAWDRRPSDPEAIAATDLFGTPACLTDIHELGNGRYTSAEDTVPYALWAAARNLDDYELAIWTTASTGGDVDTTCAIVGGIVGAHLGAVGLPAHWLSSCEPLPAWAGTAPSLQT